MKKKPLVLTFLLAFALTATGIVFATESCKKPTPVSTKLQTVWPESPLTGYALVPDTSIAEMAKYFFEWGVGLGGLAMFIALIIAGVQYITSVAEPNKLNEAKDRIKSAVIGLALLLSSWAIFQLINPNLTTMEEELPDMAKGNALFTQKPCTYNSDCCKIDDPNCDRTACPPTNPDCCPKVNDPDCVVRYWLCCQKNDGKCIEGQGRRKMPNDNTINPNIKATGDACVSDFDCPSWYCKCDKATWTKSCAPEAENETICIMSLDRPETGCNIIRFYRSGMSAPAASSPGVKCNTLAEAASSAGSSCDYVDYEMGDGWLRGGNSGWVSVTFAGQPPAAYEAITWAKDPNDPENYLYIDSSGAVTTTNTGEHMEAHCGVIGCGCTINGCLSPDPNNASCDEDDGQTGEIFAYEEWHDGLVTVFKMKDSTKSRSGKIKKGATTVVNTVWDNSIFGKIWNWWQDN